MLMVATLATLTHARQLSEQSVSVCEGIETQQCEADGEYYSCACTVCNLTRPCESNSDLYRCACPHGLRFCEDGVAEHFSDGMYLLVPHCTNLFSEDCNAARFKAG